MELSMMVGLFAGLFLAKWLMVQLADFLGGVGPDTPMPPWHDGMGLFESKTSSVDRGVRSLLDL